MARLDLDDLPPKIAAQLSGLEAGEELLLVQHGAVVARLTANVSAPEAEPKVEPDAEQRVKEVFETFRSVVEDEF